MQVRLLGQRRAWRVAWRGKKRMSHTATHDFHDYSNPSHSLKTGKIGVAAEGNPKRRVLYINGAVTSLESVCTHKE
jgi:hypothetical protein